MKPTKQDLANYFGEKSFLDSPFLDHPERFLKVGQKVKAKIRIFDLPTAGRGDWGPVHAMAGETGVVVHVEPGCWPTVRFDRTQTMTGVTDLEVEPVELKQVELAQFFHGVENGLRGLDPCEDHGQAYCKGYATGQALVKDWVTGEAEGLTASDYIETALEDLGLNNS